MADTKPTSGGMFAAGPPGDPAKMPAWDQEKVDPADDESYWGAPLPVLECLVCQKRVVPLVREFEVKGKLAYKAWCPSCKQLIRRLSKKDGALAALAEPCDRQQSMFGDTPKVVRSWKGESGEDR